MNELMDIDELINESVFCEHCKRHVFPTRTFHGDICPNCEGVI